MRWNFVPNSNTRVLALKSGEAQIADGIPFAQVESLQGESNLAIQEVELPQAVILIANNKVKALGDVHVRRALSLAINRQQLNETVFRGTGTVPNSVLMNFELDASDQEVPAFEFNLEKAKEEMAKSKFAKGFSVSLQYPAGSDYFKQMSLLIQQRAEGNRRHREAGRTGSRDDRGKVAGRGIRNDLPVRRHLERHSGAGRVRLLLRVAGGRTRRVQIVLDQQGSRRAGRKIHLQHQRSRPQGRMESDPGTVQRRNAFVERDGLPADQRASVQRNPSSW